MTFYKFIKKEGIGKKAKQLGKMLEDVGNVRMYIELINLSSKAGGGALPLLDLPSKCVGIKVQGMSANNIEKQMRENRPPIIGRIEEDFL